ncbi:MAG: DNA polymerase III subunit gamma/tau [Rhodoferax sp.]|nr:DNA polymerase III subunit gamma/tau [Rhodoferax sp.]
MSYLVLARKYRPKNFTQMVGQEHVVRALTNALDSQRLHHAYLFTGTRGVGKTTVSRILAKSLNCLGPDGAGDITSKPCGVCQACTDIDAGRFIDYTELDAASNRGIDDVQTLLEQAVYKPVQGRFKVFMIDEVHMLTGPAFNAMLKTLEEPPDYLKFVLATTDPQKVPVTVLSRCLQFNLRPMAPETIRAHLDHVLQDEGVTADVPSLRLLARAARGSMRDALSLTDQAIAFGAGKLDEVTVRQMLGSVDRSYVFRLIDALAVGDGKSVVDITDELRLQGLSAASTLEEMSVVLQRMAVAQAVPAAIDEADPEAAEAVRLAQLMPADETQLLYSMCLHGRGELGLAPDEYAALTMVLLRLLAFKPTVQRGAQLEKKTLNKSPSLAAAPATRPSESVATFAPAPAPATATAPAPAIEHATPPTRVAPAGRAAEATTQPVAPTGKITATTDAASGWTTSVAAEIGVPPGQVLHVLDKEPFVQPRTSRDNPAYAGRAELGLQPSQVLAVPVRVQADSRAEAAASSRSAQAVLIPSEEGNFWHATVQQLVASDAITALVRELALQSQLVARDIDQWVLRVERESLNQPTSRERLANALLAIGHGVQLAVEIGRVTDSPARRNAAMAAEKQLAAERIIFEDPFVQSMMRDFGAKIVPGSIKPI